MAWYWLSQGHKMINSNKAYQINALFINFLLIYLMGFFYLIVIGFGISDIQWHQHTSQLLYDRLSLSPRLAAEHAHTGYVNSNKSPSHQVLKRSQCSHKCVGVGAVWVPVAYINPQTPRAPGSGLTAHCFKEILLFLDIIDADIRQHSYLVVWYVCCFCLITHPEADALTHWVHATILWLSCPPLCPVLWSLVFCRLWIRGLFTEKHARWPVAPLVEEFGVHCGHGISCVLIVAVLRANISCSQCQIVAAEQEQQS